MMIESLHDRSINKQNMHAFTLYHISLQRKIHVNSITFVQDSISCCIITIIGESAFSGSNIGLSKVMMGSFAFHVTNPLPP